MTDHNFDVLNEQEFDALLTEELSQLPPSPELVREITPWRQAMDRILVGLALTSVTLKFLWLDYLLPTVGMVMLLLGFRSLRRENGWFRLGWVLSALRAVFQLFLIVINATVWQEEFYKVTDPPASLVSMALVLGVALCLRQGLRAVRKKAGLSPVVTAATALLVWYVILLLLGLTQYSGLLLGLPVLVSYFFILRCLYKLSRELDEAGYTVRSTPARLSDSTIKCIYFAVVVLGLLAGYLFLRQYPMDWTPTTPQTEQAGQEDVRTHLLALGFPAQVLDDLTAEDLAACRGAIRVVVDETDMAVNDGRMVETSYHTYSTIYDTRELHVTGVAVQLPGERDHWKVFHHFSWQFPPETGFRGTEAIQLWPAARDDYGWRLEGQFTGQVLCDRECISYAAPYYFLGTVDHQRRSLFWGTQSASDPFFAFSFPGGSDRQRGYVSYEMLETREGSICDSWFNYTHQRSLFQYPVQTALRARMNGDRLSMFDNFITVQDALQFFPYDEDPEPFS